MFEDIFEDIFEDDRAVLHVDKKTGGRLRDRREFLAISLEEAAAVTSVTPGYLELVERGRRNITLADLYKLLEILQMDLYEFADKEQMLLRQEICSCFEEMNRDDLEIIRTICKLLVDSKKDFKNFNNIHFLDRASRIKNRKKNPH